MKSIFLLATSLVALLAGFGCQHIEVSNEGNPERLLRGSVDAQATLPPGAEILVRLLDAAPAGPGIPTGREDLPLGDRARPVIAERVLGEFRQTLAAMTTEPVPFEIDYRAHDDELRHGLNLEVRVSFGGRVRYRTIHAHVVTLASSPFTQVVTVQPLQ